MSEVYVTLRGEGACGIEHAGSGVVIGTDRPPEYGGQGHSFSATDLVAAGLGACIATSIEGVAERAGIAFQAIRVTVEKTLSQQPKHIAALAVTIHLPTAVDNVTETKLLRAAATCPVHRSLHPDITCTIRLDDRNDRNAKDTKNGAKVAKDL